MTQARSFEYEDELEAEWEDEWEDEGEAEAEAEYFFGKIKRFMRKHKNVFRKIAKVAGPLVATAVGGPATGRTNQAIAGSLEISAWTVSTHLRRIYAKLPVSSRAEMVARQLAHADYAYLVDPTREHQR
jgi:ATP/maltotriose-dependent transcriptional regulator MalT